jgi:lipopolysaccharide export system permease protein
VLRSSNGSIVFTRKSRLFNNRMKINTIANRYLFSEVVSPFTLNILFFTFIFLLTEILEITNMIVNYKIGLLTVLRLLVFSMPYFLVFIIPMSVMMAVLLTFLRMSGDNEIVALKSCGIGIYQILPAVLGFCLIGTLLTGFMTIYGLPWGKLSLKRMTLEVAGSNIDMGIKERTFNDNFDGVMLYVNQVDVRQKELIDVFIHDERSADTGITIIAPRGRISTDPENLRFHLRLFDGSINQVNLKDQTVNATRFETYDLNIDLDPAALRRETGSKDEKEMSLTELRRFIRTRPEKDDRYYNALLEYHKKFSIPFACIFLGILAVPLGVQSKTARPSFGLGLGLFLFMLYYLMLSAGLVFGEAGIYPPVVGMWAPNFVIGGIGIYLLIRTVEGRTIYIDRLPRLFRILRR